MKSKASEFLSRLINNNEPGYFFLEGQGTALGSDCAAFLNLSIALKSDLHFAACKRAKVLQLRAEFQAKLGWLVGQLYSRVGTQDWEQASLQRKINSLLGEAAIWVPDSTISHLEKEFAKRAGEGVDTPMTPHYPEATLDLMNRVTPQALARPLYELPKVLALIAETQPILTSDERYLRLIDLVERS